MFNKLIHCKSKLCYLIMRTIEINIEMKINLAHNKHRVGSFLHDIVILHS